MPYFKQSDRSTARVCGPNDGNDYANLDTIVLGEVDQCYAHSPNGEGYHMHGAPVCLMDVHDPGKPIAYMADGIPLYFGLGRGTIEATLHAQSADAVTTTNYGTGYYEHLDYRPSDAIDGSNPINVCNGYDLNADGSTSGYVYYTSKDAPYTIGCFMGEIPESTAGGAINTKLISQRSGWNGQVLGDAMEVMVTAYDTMTYNNKTYATTTFVITGDTPSFLEAGKTPQVLWSVLDIDDELYDASTTCFEFRYRKDNDIDSNDTTEVLCAERVVSEETLDFTPFG